MKVQIKNFSGETMRIDPLNQLLTFSLALALGAVQFILYSVFALIRKLFRNGIAVCWITDILFCLVCALLFLVFSFIVSAGQVRLYLVIGTLLGFLLLLWLSCVFRALFRRRRKNVEKKLQ